MKSIVLIYGGKSVEREISIITALQVYRIAKRNYDCKLVYLDENGKWWTGKNLENPSIYCNSYKFCKKKISVKACFGEGELLFGKKRFKPESAVLCCHGLNGEDGSVASVLELANIPYTSSSIFSSAVTMDKIATKIILEFNKIETAKFSWLKRSEIIDDKNLTYPLILKPSNLGSSVGISVCYDKNSFDEALNIAFEFDDKVLIEQYLTDAEEFNCACFRYKSNLFTSNVAKVKKGEIFSFDEKYLKENERDLEKIEQSLVDEIKTLTQKVYDIFDCFGVVRVDYLYKDKKLYVNEINSIPGALACYLFPQKFDEILDLLIEESKVRFENKKRIKYSYKSDALKVFESLSKKTILKK